MCSPPALLPGLELEGPLIRLVVRHGRAEGADVRHQLRARREGEGVALELEEGFDGTPLHLTLHPVDHPRPFHVVPVPLCVVMVVRMGEHWIHV